MVAIRTCLDVISWAPKGAQNAKWSRVVGTGEDHLDVADLLVLCALAQVGGERSERAGTGNRPHKNGQGRLDGFPRSSTITRAAFRPQASVTPEPGWVPEPQR